MEGGVGVKVMGERSGEGGERKEKKEKTVNSRCKLQE